MPDAMFISVDFPLRGPSGTPAVRVKFPGYPKLHPGGGRCRALLLIRVLPRPLGETAETEI
jgi:hypothetical protein